jgi:hypothetical protein
MGNRAFVIFANKDWTTFSPAVYLHWNGGPESVYAFLEELNHREVRADQEYECARFIQIVGEFFDSGEYYTSLSLGVESVPVTFVSGGLPVVEIPVLAKKYEPGDNGLYLVCREGTDKEDDALIKELEKTGKWPMQVRRFLSGKELSKVQVMAERKVAEQTDTYIAIGEVFRQYDRGRCLESEWMKKIVKPKEQVKVLQAELETVTQFLKGGIK